MTKTTGKIRVLLVDDHAVVRSGIKMLLDAEPDIEVMAEAADAEEGKRKAAAIKPDVVLLDLVMPGPSPLKSIPEIVDEKTKVIVLTMQSDPAYAREALQAGASGYMLKEAADIELVETVRQIAAGNTYVDPTMGARLATEPDGSEERELPGDLSERELEVLKLLALGHTNQEVAKMLFISVRTVESHRAHIQQKLSLTTRAELVKFALEHELISSEASEYTQKG